MMKIYYNSSYKILQIFIFEISNPNANYFKFIFHY